MIRKEAVLRISQKHPVSQSEDLKTFDVTANYGDDVFSDAVMRRCLPKSAYKAITSSIDSGLHEIVDPAVADMVANAMKVWAVERGATHFTHWFQPMTGSTAEKHDSFISETDPSGVGKGGAPMLSFSGKELMRGEPDASSFPSGGIRSTFEARGYTVWDPNSPPFIRRQQNGNFLSIPTAFCSWTGAALDKRTPLLRSDEALSKACVRILKLLGDDKSKLVCSTLGPEQEFFLIDRDFYLARPDLVACGRTLMGPLPARHQQLSDHYFGSIHPRVIALIQEVEKQVWRLGVPTKTRHNEVAPAQWEMAPVFEKAVLANDHNIVLMEILRETARKHGFECLLHEKPFAHINGSGKHNNWSMMTDSGDNLLEPGHDPLTNQRFMTFLAAIMKAVDNYSDLLRWAVASASNDNRLGGHEAPPAIISVFLGSQLEQVVEDFVGVDEDAKSPRVTQPKYVKLGVSSLPPIPRDMTDRNRTSPFAFTGNKFEFRAVGSAQTCARAVMVINTIVADAIHQLCDSIDAKIAKGADKQTALHATLVEAFKKHKRILFSGDGYSQEWRAEAAKRGLPILASTPEAIEAFSQQKNIQLFDRLKVMSPVEATARTTIFLENYCHSVGIEAKTLFNMAKVMLLPAGIKYQQVVAKSIADAKSVNPALDMTEQTKLLASVTTTVNNLLKALEKLMADVETVHTHKDLASKAAFYRDHVKYSQEAVRKEVDTLEELVDDELWPVPKYSEMLFLR